MLSRLMKKLQPKKHETAESDVKVEKRETFEQAMDGKMETMALAEAGTQEISLHGRTERQRILLVGREDNFSEPVMDYAISLAERLGYDIIAMNINTVTGYSGKFLSPFRKHLNEEFEKRAEEAFAVLAEKMKGKDIHCEHVVKYGEFSRAVDELHHEIRRIEFVVTEPEAHAEKDEVEVAIPVFSMQR